MGRCEHKAPSEDEVSSDEGASDMGIDVEYDGNAERCRTQPLLMPKLEPVSLTWDDTEVLKKVKILVP